MEPKLKPIVKFFFDVQTLHQISMDKTWEFFRQKFSHLMISKKSILICSFGRKKRDLRFIFEIFEKKLEKISTISIKKQECLKKSSSSLILTSQYMNSLSYLILMKSERKIFINAWIFQ